MKIKNLLYIMIFVFAALIFNVNKIEAAMSFNINNNEGIYSDYDNKQFTRNRNLLITLNLTTQELSSYAGIQICEYDGPSGGSNPDKCNQYEYPSVNNSYVYQVTSYGDGTKYIGVDLLNQGTTNIYTNMRKEINIDTTGPAITLNGNKDIYLLKGSDYNELGAICDDEFDINPIITTSTNSIDTSEYGVVQYVTYTATDFLGNVNQVQRRIVVEAAPDSEINSKLVIGIFIAAVIGGVLIYIKIWQNKEKKKQKEKSYYQKRSSVL